MGALPKKKLSKARSGKRKATKTYALPQLSICSNCGKQKLAHVVCSHCGYYKKEIFKPKEAVKVTKVKNEKRNER